MTDEIKTRLQETSETCLKCYEEWQGQKKDRAASEALQDAVHELRKVASRLEIDLAISERSDVTQKKIPIPAHRDSRNRYHQPDDHQGGNGNNAGRNTSSQSKPRRRPNNNGPKKPAATGAKEG